MEERRIQGLQPPALAKFVEHTDKSAALAYWLASLMALACIFYLFTPAFLLGDATVFLQGDAAQHVSGWRFYRDDAWRFPLLLTERMNAPEGTSIAFTDSIPLVALLLKPFRIWLPEGFHYIGLWHAVVYLLQSLAAVYLIRALGVRSLFATLIAVGFALTWPPLLMRFGHTSLLTHALILFSFALYFYQRNGALTFYAAGRRYLLLLCVALTIHPYLLAMSYTVFLAYLLDNAWRQKSVRDSFLLLLASLLLIASLYYVLGYGGSALQTAGFGLYSMNLLSPFCGGRLLSCATDATGGQGFEGYNYFGAGLLFLAALVLWRSRKDVLQLPRVYPALCMMMTGIAIYALSNKICFSTHCLPAYPLPALLQKLADTFRCSGRFFWPVGYLILFVVLANLAKIATRKWNVVMLIALLVQIYDTAPMRDRVRAQVRQPALATTMDWKALLQNVDNIDVYPVYGCGDDYGEFQLRYQTLAAHFHKIINTGYVARVANLCAEKHRMFDAEFLPRRLYVAPADRTGGIQYLPKGFAAALARHECIKLDIDMLCMAGWHADELIAQFPAFKPADAVGSAPQWRLLPPFLFTGIGVREGNLLVAPRGAVGFLSFGPYRSIGPGRYDVAISLDVSRCADGIIGRWDVSAALGTQQLAKYDIRAANGRAVVEGSFATSEELNKLEIRTFSNGACEFRLHEITLTKPQ